MLQMRKVRFAIVTSIAVIWELFTAIWCHVIDLIMLLT